MATNAYFSVSPFGTGDLKIGSPSLSVDAGVGTLTVAQTGNIGVGCIIAYAGGECYIASVIDSQNFNVVDELGVTKGNLNNKSVSSIHHVFASMNDAIEGAGAIMGDTDLRSGTGIDVVLNIPCYADHDDQSADAVAATTDVYTTDVTHYVNIYTPCTSSECISDESGVGRYQRHKGVLNTNAYWMSTSGDDIKIANDYVRIAGIQIVKGNTSCGIWVTGQTASNLLYVSNCIIDGADYGCRGIFVDDADTNLYLWNTIVYDCDYSYWGNIGINAATAAYIYNCTAYGGDIGIRGTAATRCVNCLCDSNGATGDFYGTFHDDSDYNCVSNAVAETGGDNDHTSHDFTYITEGSDFHLASNDLGAIGFGTDSVAPINFTDDIDGETRGATWDVGADQYVAEGPSARTVTVSGTLAAITSSNATKVLISAISASTLAALTSSVQIKTLQDRIATIEAALSPLTSEISSAVLVGGSSAATLAAITSVEDTDVLVDSDIAAALAALTSQLDAEVLVTADIIATLSALTASLSVDTSGARIASVVATLSALIASLNTQVKISNEVVATLAALTSSLEVGVLVTSDVIANLAALTSSLETSVIVGIQVGANLAALTSSGVATVLIQESVVAVLEALTASINVTSLVQGTVVATLSAITCRVRVSTTGVVLSVGFPFIDGLDTSILGG